MAVLKLNLQLYPDVVNVSSDPLATLELSDLPSAANDLPTNPSQHLCGMGKSHQHL